MHVLKMGRKYSYSNYLEASGNWALGVWELVTPVQELGLKFPSIMLGLLHYYLKNIMGSYTSD